MNSFISQSNIRNPSSCFHQIDELLRMRGILVDLNRRSPQDSISSTPSPFFLQSLHNKPLRSLSTSSSTLVDASSIQYLRDDKALPSSARV
ncbi:hypothetical protein ES332_A13G147900v1 [Gossypium tomentosum]|uniref:Uncharacterized protein n=1 Tax=Gossypium tomentosum TaxID=34277 RepID=A0A5D2MKH0_GOSTO|nr:hypothetical protein ES332_A13G147900v1 [Gossypium tomentosum]